jgi:hypothetical protein
MYRHRNAALRHKWGGGQYYDTARDEGSTCMVARAARLQRGVLDPLPSHIQHNYTDTYVERNSVSGSNSVAVLKRVGLGHQPRLQKYTYFKHTQLVGSVERYCRTFLFRLMSCARRKNKNDETLRPVPPVKCTLVLRNYIVEMAGWR